MTPLAGEVLGFGPDARVLIVNADDLGMSPSITTAVVDAIDHGIVRSTSLMSVCPAPRTRWRCSASDPTSRSAST